MSTVFTTSVRTQILSPEGLLVCRCKRKKKKEKRKKEKRKIDKNQTVSSEDLLVCR